MSISHAQHLFLLFVGSLFFSPVLSETFFDNCNFAPFYRYPIEVHKVRISPNPVKYSGNGKITINAFTPKAIPQDAPVNLRLALGFSQFNSSIVSTKSYSLCDVTACPVIEPGFIRFKFTKIFTSEEKKTALGYYVIISITDNDLKDDMMCIQFPCRFSGIPSLA